MRRVARWVAAAVVVVLGAAAPSNSSRAAGPHELFVDAAWGGKLEVGDVAMLELAAPECFLASKQAKALFCVAHTRMADGSERWDGAIVGVGGVQFSARLLTRGGDDEEPADDAKGRAQVNKALKKVRWSGEASPVRDYVLREGRRADDGGAVAFALPDGRQAQLTATGVRADDGVALAVEPVAGRPLTTVVVYALAGTKALVAAVDDAEKDSRASACESRFVVSGVATEPAPALDGPVVAPAAGGGVGEADAARPCPRGVWCPPGYGALYALLGRFCEDRFDAAALAEAAALADRGALGPDDLAVLFNAYGALYAYEFKQKKDYNSFYYGAGLAAAVAGARAWLPPGCRGAFGKFTTATLPPSLRQARDDVKALWSKHK